jgi:CRISPR/Cas system-associated exonuclease Cas4 (RecB family)
MYLRCPKQYEFRYIKRMVRPPSLSLVVGSSVHKSIEVNYATKFKKKAAVERDAAMDAYSTEFEKLKHDAELAGESLGEAKDRGYSWAGAHYDVVAPTLNPLEMPEFEFKVEVPGVKRKLYGFIDVIGEPVSAFRSVPPAKGAKAPKKPKRVIFDNKTSKRKYDRLAVELSAQLTSYDYAHEKVFGTRPDGVGFDVLTQETDKKTREKTAVVQRLATTRTPEELARFVDTVVAVDKGINAGSFPPVDDPKTCSWCGYRELCNKAATRRAAQFDV